MGWVFLNEQASLEELADRIRWIKCDTCIQREPITLHLLVGMQDTPWRCEICGTKNNLPKFDRRNLGRELVNAMIDLDRGGKAIEGRRSK